MAHGRNNPTGAITVSPLALALFAPIAFVARAWECALIAFVVTFLLLLLWGIACHNRDLKTAARRRELERERGF